MSHQRVRLFVTGRVQGVFFRQSLKAKSISSECFWMGKKSFMKNQIEEKISIG